MSVITTDRPIHVEPEPGVPAPASTYPRAAAQLGFCSAILTALLSVAWSVVLLYQQALAPLPPWRGGVTFAHSYKAIHFLSVYPSLFLAMAFMVMMVSLHYYAPEEKKVWSMVGVAFSILYAVMASMNYLIQLAAIKPSLAAGETDGIGLFALNNTHSIFFALMNSYAYICFALLFTAPIFTGGRLERWIKRLFLVMGAVGVAQLAVGVFSLPGSLSLIYGPAWIVGLPLAAILLAVVFRRAPA